MADFAQHQAELEALGVQVVALSADEEEGARRTQEQLGLRFTLAWGLDPEAVSNTIGCYTGTREGRAHIQPAAFVLGPDGAILHAVYSSGKVGRFTASDAIVIAKEMGTK